MSINERLFSLLANSGRSQKDLAVAIGTSERNISAWKQRGSDPPASLVMGIADFLDVPLVYLLSGSGSGNASSPPQSVEEGELLRLYRALDVKRRVRLLDMAFSLEDETRAQ
jgi:transcriptional regulator with XRE-family HTH domain